MEGRVIGQNAEQQHHQQQQTLRLLHLSDTHNMHNEIEKALPLPDADILFHTGDLTDRGTMEELRDANEWLGTLKQRFRHIVVIAGNHDVHGNKGRIDLKTVLTNATILHHEIAEGVLADLGLKVYGSPWCAWKCASDPGGEGHLFDQLPEGMDVLMTHGPADKIFDVAGYSIDVQKRKGKNVERLQHWQWGSCAELNDAIRRARPRVHLFGHLHEQRGVWQRSPTGAYLGGVEYEAAPGKAFPTIGPPPKDYPCDLISCNAMCNHSDHEEEATGNDAHRHIAGPPRLIIASRNSDNDPWQFSALLQ